MQRQVVLVDENDREVGTTDIDQAHLGKGQKHRALSVVLYRKKQGKTELLLQKRAETKPVFKGLWANTMCTNMRPGDEYMMRAVTRLEEEMGIKMRVEDLRTLYRFSYEANDWTNPGWGENELDTVVVGQWLGGMKLNPEEVEEAKWMEWGELQRDVKNKPEEYAPWLRMIVKDNRLIINSKKEK
ncbi:TPA: isopentenyl-diphosphate delta-isomerase [Candidatus Collierbacteria bacterium]|uniref:Isopentenyl-diphosphate delta-isomerase n=1 Tax=Candidatus Collierbacteria bacterium RIFOXYA2_FULL_46_10 TaxID=1817726 RepID=A0A1F5F3Z9_9BACT|nr:MAG: Isopentenyl-diphosphate Delta-isomerase [Microgenomates group bacterium GW2011_GWF1_46_12]KKU27906.1 MAG: Isopentenyl-diphosphate Delta-isomerase [Microgenomates group bacterium GW2011_GWF2_46_18]KKU44965.1 MAG: Isopentenyl-diphosphate Delta-isomerase [Microgenomates group bacterium GW2011_GWB1_46_7]KKU60927.1 MAG: Isopentenyl-diphosphate Delta-isomerase [Microgenomates group bacterium GW2011_GWE1_47_12]KKU62796.1 MAG: Isopentenyl-diphosphate Delta-isomerase [Microgenomates group bacter